MSLHTFEFRQVRIQIKVEQSKVALKQAKLFLFREIATVSNISTSRRDVRLF